MIITTSNKINSRHVLLIKFEECLVKKISENEVKMRPYLENFLEEIYKLFDVCLLTNFEEKEVNVLINQIDPESKYIQDIVLIHQNDASDLIDELIETGMIGEKTVIIKSSDDKLMRNIGKEFLIPFWDGDQCDSSLKNIMPILKNIVQLKIENIEEYISNIRDQMIINIGKGSLTPYGHFI